MNIETLTQIAKKLQKYLQNDYADEWHVQLENEEIVGYYTDIKRFTLKFDDDCEEWNISGEELDLTMVDDISKIVDRIVSMT